MNSRRQHITTILIDILTINLAYLAYYVFRVRSGLVPYSIEPELILPMMIICMYWLIWFGLFGLYRLWYEQSRIDEILTIVRSTIVGALVLFFLIFLDDTSNETIVQSRLLIFGYWFALTGLVIAGRLLQRSIQRRLLVAGVGLRNTLIIGWSEKAFKLCDMVLKYPALGYKVVGFVKAKTKSDGPQKIKSNLYQKIPILGSIQDVGISHQETYNS